MTDKKYNLNVDVSSVLDAAKSLEDMAQSVYQLERRTSDLNDVGGQLAHTWKAVDDTGKEYILTVEKIVDSKRNLIKVTEDYAAAERKNQQEQAAVAQSRIQSIQQVNDKIIEVEKQRKEVALQLEKETTDETKAERDRLNRMLGTLSNQRNALERQLASSLAESMKVSNEEILSTWTKLQTNRLSQLTVTETQIAQILKRAVDDTKQTYEKQAEIRQQTEKTIQQNIQKEIEAASRENEKILAARAAEQKKFEAQEIRDFQKKEEERQQIAANYQKMFAKLREEEIAAEKKIYDAVIKMKKQQFDEEQKEQAAFNKVLEKEVKAAKKEEEKLNKEAAKLNKQILSEKQDEEENYGKLIIAAEKEVARQKETLYRDTLKARKQVLEEEKRAEKERIAEAEARIDAERVVVDQLNQMYQASTNKIRELEKEKSDAQSLYGKARVNKEAELNKQIENIQKQQANIIQATLESLARQHGITTTEIQKMWARVQAGDLKNLPGTYNKVQSALIKLDAQVIKTGNSFKRSNDVLTTTTARTKDLTLSWRSMMRIFTVQGAHRAISRLSTEIKDSIVDFIELEKRIGLIRTISQSAGLSQEYWTQQLLKLSDAFGLSVLDQAEGAYLALTNQIVNGAEALRFLAKANQLAVTTSSKTSEAVNALASVINAFGLSVYETDRLVTSFFKTVEYGRVRLAEMANDIGTVAEFSDQLSVRFEELSAIIDIITIQGVKYSQASTQIRGIMVKLIKPTAEMSRFFTAIGVESGKAAIETYGLVGVLKLMQEYSEGNVKVLAEMVNRVRGLMGILAGTSNVEDMQRILDETTDSAESFAMALDAAMTTTGKQIEIELNKIKNYFINDFGGQIAKFFFDLTNRFGTLSEIAKKLTRMLLVLIPTVTLTYTANLIGQIVILTKQFFVAKKAGDAFRLTMLKVIPMLTFAVSFVIFTRMEAALASLSKAMESLGEVSRDIFDSIFEQGEKRISELLNTYRKVIAGQVQEQLKLVAENRKTITQWVNEIEKGLKANARSFAKFAKDAEKSIDKMVSNTSKRIGDLEKAIESIAEEILKIKDSTIQFAFELDLDEASASEQFLLIEKKIAELTKESAKAAEVGNQEIVNKNAAAIQNLIQRQNDLVKSYKQTQADRVRIIDEANREIQKLESERNALSLRNDVAAADRRKEIAAEIAEKQTIVADTKLLSRVDKINNKELEVLVDKERLLDRHKKLMKDQLDLQEKLSEAVQKELALRIKQQQYEESVKKIYSDAMNQFSDAQKNLKDTAPIEEQIKAAQDMIESLQALKVLSELEDINLGLDTETIEKQFKSMVDRLAVIQTKGQVERSAKAITETKTLFDEEVKALTEGRKQAEEQAQKIINKLSEVNKEFGIVLQSGNALNRTFQKFSTAEFEKVLHEGQSIYDWYTGVEKVQVQGGLGKRIIGELPDAAALTREAMATAGPGGMLNFDATDAAKNLQSTVTVALGQIQEEMEQFSRAVALQIPEDIEKYSKKATASMNTMLFQLQILTERGLYSEKQFDEVRKVFTALTDAFKDDTGIRNQIKLYNKTEEDLKEVVKQAENLQDIDITLLPEELGAKIEALQAGLKQTGMDVTASFAKQKADIENILKITKNRIIEEEKEVGLTEENEEAIKKVLALTAERLKLEQQIVEERRRTQLSSFETLRQGILRGSTATIQAIRDMVAVLNNEVANAAERLSQIVESNKNRLEEMREELKADAFAALSPKDQLKELEREMQRIRDLSAVETDFTAFEGQRTLLQEMLDQWIQIAQQQGIEVDIAGVKQQFFKDELKLREQFEQQAKAEKENAEGALSAEEQKLQTFQDLLAKLATVDFEKVLKLPEAQQLQEFKGLIETIKEIEGYQFIDATQLDLLAQELPSFGELLVHPMRSVFDDFGFIIGSFVDAVNNLSGSRIQGYQHGGLVTGPRGNDRVPARLTSGEFVVNPKATSRFYDQLSAMNAYTGNTTVGDINVNYRTSGNSQVDIMQIARGIQRGIKQGTIRL